MSRDPDHDVELGWFPKSLHERRAVRRPPGWPDWDITEPEWPGWAGNPGWMVHPFERARRRILAHRPVPVPRAARSPSWREWRERKARLLACTAARRAWAALPGPPGGRLRRVVATTERYAAGRASADELWSAYCHALGALGWAYRPPGADAGAGPAVRPPRAGLPSPIRERPTDPLGDPAAAARLASVGVAFAPLEASDAPFYLGRVLFNAAEAVGEGGAAGLCDLVRDVFGNPFRPVEFDPAWRTEDAVLLARQMYASHDFSGMPVLADALQEAGCEDEAILAHCRGPVHVHSRGCWVVDLVLGKC